MHANSTQLRQWLMDNEVACLAEVSIVIKWFEQKSLQFSGSCLEFWLSFLLNIVFLTDIILRWRICWLPDSGVVLRLDKCDPGPAVSANLGPDLRPWRLAALALEVAPPPHLSPIQTWLHGSVLFTVGCHCSAHVWCAASLLPHTDQACCCWGCRLSTAGPGLPRPQLIRNITQGSAWCHNNNPLGEDLQKSKIEFWESVLKYKSRVLWRWRKNIILFVQYS